MDKQNTLERFIRAALAADGLTRLSLLLSVFSATFAVMVPMGGAWQGFAEAAAGGFSILTLGTLLWRTAQGSDNQSDEVGYRAFFENAVEGIFRSTAGGRCLVANKAMANICGFETSEAFVEKYHDLSTQFYVDEERRTVFHSLMEEHGVVSDFVSEVRHASGAHIWISENAWVVRSEAGQVLYYEGTVQDVTEKLVSEWAQRSAFRQAELANLAKSSFLAAMSHELKTPLNAVIGFSEIIRDELFGPSGVPAYREYAGDIHKSGVRLLSTINDVLDVSRFQSGALALDARELDARDILEQAIEVAHARSGDSRPVPVDVDPKLSTLLVDPRRLTQALGNLIANALKFTPETGCIFASARLIDGGGARFEIRDSGIGMDRETITAALEPFKQLDGTLARKFEGTGLGLTISQAMLHLHGASLTIESALGLGTTVIVDMPAARVSPRAEAAA